MIYSFQFNTVVLNCKYHTIYTQTLTHQLARYLPQCDVIVTIENGKITKVGAYSELIDSNAAFAEFVHTYTSMEDDDKETETGNQQYSLIISFDGSLFYYSYLVTYGRVEGNCIQNEMWKRIKNQNSSFVIFGEDDRSTQPAIDYL